MVKALFFDVDGTLISFHTHNVPDSTIKALQLAKQNGVKVFISTGRPKPLICNLDQIMPLVDGWVTTNGAYCYIEQQEINCDTIASEVVNTVIANSKRIGVPCFVVGVKHYAIINPNDNFDFIFRQLLRITTLNDFSRIEDVLNEGVLQLTPFFDADKEKELLPYLTNCEIGRWHPDFIDITAKGIDKGYGLEQVTKHLGLNINETMAFGDGGNDIPIIVKSGIGVAMENAGADVKQSADFVTTSVDEDGVYNALKHFNII